jgi:hypothetical protein
MYFMRFASFAWGAYAGYKHSPLFVVLEVSASLAIGNVVINFRQLFPSNGPKISGGNVTGALAIYFGFALFTSLMSQGFGYLLGYFIRGAS